MTRIAPDKDNPHTWRDFCAKGRTAHESVEHPNRIRHPMRRVGDRFVRVSWEEAIASIGASLRTVIDRGGADAVGVYWGNPAGFSTATPIFLAGLMDGIGTQNRYYVGSVDQNNHSVVAEAMYGSPLTMLVPDVDESDCFLLVGTNPAVSGFSWMFGIVPDGWRRVLAAKVRGASVIVVDPVRTATAAEADLHVAIRPGEDWAFLLAVVKVILENGWEHRDDCMRAVGLDDLRLLVATADLGDLAARADVSIEVVREVAERFATAPKALCVAATGVAHTLAGTIGEWLSNVLNVITGRIDRPGGRRYERGYVDAASLWAAMAPKRAGRSRVRGFPVVQGHMPLATMAEDISVPGDGQIRAVMIVAGNPVISGPQGDALDKALAGVDLLVAVDFVQRESHRHAHWLIPAAHWLERDDILVLMSQAHDQPFAQLGRKVIEPPPEVREEWRFFLDLALATGVPFFGHRGVNTGVRISRLAARLSRRPALAFNPRWIERGLVAYGRRIRWRDLINHPHGYVYGKKSYGDFATHGIRTPDKRIQVAPAALVRATADLLRTPRREPPERFPLVLCNQRAPRSMNSWLNDLPGMHPDRRGNELEISAQDAVTFGVTDGEPVVVSSAVASVTMPARVSDRMRPGVVAAAHGWGSRVFDPETGEVASTAGANRNALVANAELDQFSGIPALNETYVRVDPAPGATLEMPRRSPARS